MIYEKDGSFYINKGVLYLEVKVSIKNDDLVVTPTSKSVTVLHNAKRYTQNELKNKLIK